MTCDDTILAAYLEDELDEVEAASWDQHLLECDKCWDALDEALRGRELASSLHTRAPAGLRGSVESAVRAAATPGRPARRGALRATVSAAAAVLLIAAAAVFVVTREADGSEDPKSIAVVLELAADLGETPPPPNDGILITRLDVHGHDVVLARSERLFPMPNGAMALADDPASPWLARRGELTLLCYSHPAPLLLAGQASPETLLEVASALGLAAPT